MGTYFPQSNYAIETVVWTNFPYTNDTIAIILRTYFPYLNDAIEMIVEVYFSLTQTMLLGQISLSQMMPQRLLLGHHSLTCMFINCLCFISFRGYVSMLLLSVFYFSFHVYDGPPCVLCVIIVCILHNVSTHCRFVMALLPTTDSRRFLPRS